MFQSGRFILCCKSSSLVSVSSGLKVAYFLQTTTTNRERQRETKQNLKQIDKKIENALKY